MAQERWVLDAENSQITYQAKHFLHAWSGTNNSVNGLAIKEAGRFTQMAMVMAVKDFNSGNPSRDANAVEVLEVLSFPNIEFTSSKIIDKESLVEVSGKILFHGIGIEKTISAALIKPTKNEVQLKGDFELNLTDFNIKLPSFMLKKMSESVQVSYLFSFKKQ